MMKVLVGMSGGLDSAAAAIILKQQGCEVIAVSIDFYTEQVGDIPLFKENIHDAAELCRLLNIPHHTVHAGNEFNTVVFDYFIRGYLSGITPFPCIVCNNKIKWPLLIEKANGLGCELIATGHYAKSIQNNLKYYITEGVDKDKDQSFFLWGINQEILKRAVFPLGNLAKGQVKEIVKKYNPQLANKKESTGVCFLKEQNYRPFLKNYINEKSILIKPGNYVNLNGDILGQHEGFPFYTIGQRRKLSLYTGKPYYVINIIPDRNEVILGDKKDLYKTTIFIRDFQLVNKDDFNNTIIVKIRYRKQATPAKVIFLNDKEIRINLLEPLDSIAPGQTAVFYSGEKVIGGGFIKSSL